MACIKKFLFLVSLGGFDGTVEFSVDLCGHSFVSLVEIFRPFVFVKVEIRKCLTGILEFVTDPGHSLHICFKLHAHLAAEDVDEFYRRCGRTTTEPPYVGIDDIHTLDDGCQHCSQTVAGCAMSMEIHRHLKSGLKLGHKAVDTRGTYESGHILKGDHLCSEFLHLFGLLYKILVGENFLILGSTFRIDCIAYSGICDTAQLVDHTDGALDIIDVIERVENTHHIETVLDSLLVKTFEHRIGIRHIAEQVAATGKSRKKRYALHCLATFAKTVPGAFAEVTHHRVGNGTAPDFHNIELGVSIERKKFVNILLLHTGGE